MPLDRGEYRAGEPEAFQPGIFAEPEAGGQGGSTDVRKADRQGAVDQDERRVFERREPAEGGHREMAAAEPDGVHHGRADEGIDVGAKYEIYKIMCDLAQQGAGVIMISSELPEIIGVCDRALVMAEGRITGEVQGTT